MVVAAFSAKVLKLCSQRFSAHPTYADAETAITKIISAIPTHTELPGVLAKVAVIKTLYATTLYDTGSMARHICSIPDIDYSLSHGNLVIVDRIRQGHGITSRKTIKEMDFYSFATKYCSFHNREAYPVFDNLVADLVKGLLNATGDMRNYGFFTSCIDNIRQQYATDLETYKDIDMGLWVYAKYIREQTIPSSNLAERAFLADLGERLLTET
jgi:hypothetical protein